MKIKCLHGSTHLLVWIGMFYGLTALAVSPSVSPDIDIYLSGTSTETESAISSVWDSICVYGTNDKYDNGSLFSPITSYPFATEAAFYCTLDTSNPTVAGLLPNWMTSHPGVNPNVLLHMQLASDSYSAKGVLPLLHNLPVERMNIWNSLTNSTNCNQRAGIWHCTTSNAGDTTSAYLDAGVSEVNPSLFVGGNVYTGTDPVNFSDVSDKLEVHSLDAVVYGIKVSPKLYNALWI